MSLDIVAVDSALQLRLTDFDSNISPFRPKSSATSTAASSSREGSLRDTFEAVSINHVVNFSLELNLANIGISIINKRVQVHLLVYLLICRCSTYFDGRKWLMQRYEMYASSIQIPINTNQFAQAFSGCR